MKKLVGKVLASTLAVSTILGAVPAFASGTDGATQGTNTFVDGGTDIQFWTFQELHVPFWTSMADEWNKQTRTDRST